MSGKELVNLCNNKMLKSKNIEYNGIPLNEFLGTIIESGGNKNGNWIKFGEGTLIQYGNAEHKSNENFKQVYFPVAFRDTSYCFSAIGSYNYFANICFVISSLLQDRINVYVQKGDGTKLDQNQTFYWFAIGKWK